MRSLFFYFALLVGSGIIFPVQAQNFVNGDLNGTVSVSSIPTSWASVPNTDPLCTASGPLQATADVTSVSGPFASAGISGQPHNGTTFVSGLRHDLSGSIYHEGIMQTVSGLVPGNTYKISFWQTNVKQSNALDQTGGWAVYANSTLLAMTAPTFSALAFNATNLPWEQRSVVFAATATTHTFKFLPNDDDANITAPNNSIRVGIDSINLKPMVILAAENPFTLGQVGRAVKLDWERSDLNRIRNFRVQRSADGEHFETLVQVPASGRSGFEYLDRFPLEGTSFYRICREEWNGDLYFSGVESIRLEAKVFDLYCDGQSLLEFSGAEVPTPLMILDLQGKEVFRGEFQGKLDLGFLEGGIYLAKARDVFDPQRWVTRRISVRR